MKFSRVVAKAWATVWPDSPHPSSRNKMTPDMITILEPENERPDRRDQRNPENLGRAFLPGMHGIMY